MIIALDIATTTGFAYGPAGAQPPLLQWGSRSFGQGKSNGEVVSTFRAWQNELCYRLRPTLVVYETPYIPVGAKPGGGPPMNPLVLRRLLGMTSAVEAICFELRIPCREAVSAAFTKFVTGKGRYKSRAEKKQAVIQSCHWYGLAVEDDNQADACALWLYTESFVDPRASEHRRRAAADREREDGGAGPLFSDPENENASRGPVPGGADQPTPGDQSKWSRVTTRI